MKCYVITDNLVVIAVIESTDRDVIATPAELSVLDEASLEALGNDVIYADGRLDDNSI